MTRLAQLGDHVLGGDGLPVAPDSVADDVVDDGRRRDAHRRARRVKRRDEGVLQSERGPSARLGQLGKVPLDEDECEAAQAARTQQWWQQLVLGALDLRDGMCGHTMARPSANPQPEGNARSKRTR